VQRVDGLVDDEFDFDDHGEVRPKSFMKFLKRNFRIQRFFSYALRFSDTF